MYSISRGGRVRVLGMSMKEERVLIPGGEGFEGCFCCCTWDEGDWMGCGAGGGVGKGDEGLCCCVSGEDFAGADCDCEGLFLSLCTAFNSSTFDNPSSCAFCCSLCRYFSVIRSGWWVARKRMSCTRAKRRWTRIEGQWESLILRAPMRFTGSILYPSDTSI